MSLAQDAGRLFEAGFMLGVIRAVRSVVPAPPDHLIAHYDNQRRSYNIPAVLAEFAKHSPTRRAALHTLGRYYLCKGHLAGYHLLREYTHALADRNGADDWTRRKTLEQLELRYWQCTLLGENRLAGPRTEAELAHEEQAWLAQLQLGLESVTTRDRSTGGFLKADLLMCWRDHRGSRDHVLVVDASTFGPGAGAPSADLTDGHGLLQLLARDVRYMANKGAFARLAVEMGAHGASLLRDDLTSYFTAFTGGDRETTKLIQAGSYARGFARLLAAHHVVDDVASTTFTIAGCTDRGMNSMVLTGREMVLLDACEAIYRDGKHAYTDQQAPLETAREALLQRIENGVAQLFPEGRRFITSLRNDLVDRTYEETLDAAPAANEQIVDEADSRGVPPRRDVGVTAAAPALQAEPLHFFGTAAPLPPSVLQALDLPERAMRTEELPSGRGAQSAPEHGTIYDARWAHAQVVKRALAGPHRFIFLTGNPGIGKTTAVAEYLRDTCAADGFFFFYASPRKLVNHDIFERFTKDLALLPGFVGLETNAVLIKDHGGGKAVRFFGLEDNLPASTRGVRFLVASDDTSATGQRTTHRSRLRLRRESATVLRDQMRARAGVLDTLSTAAGAALRIDRPNAVVAAVALQSLRRSETQGDTLQHLFANLFQAARDSRHIPPYDENKMRALAQTTKHLIFMVDEVTGDPAGYAFFDRLAALLDEHDLERFGFVVRLIVADASLVGTDLVQRHLKLGQKQPDARKLWIAPVSHADRARTGAPVSIEACAFSRADGLADAYLINANTFPASRLHLTYHIHMPAGHLPDAPTVASQRRALASGDLEREVDDHIIRDVIAFLHAHAGDGEQALVYVQNKRRLERIIGAVARAQAAAGQPFARGEHYVAIDARLSPDDRALVAQEEIRDRFRVCFMTSSASRGLTFRRATHLFLDVPRFAVETNLMELVQVIYRGRGYPNDGAEKRLTFYLSDRILVDPEAPPAAQEWRRREAVIDCLTILALIKLCVLTRIAGYAPLGDAAVRAVPLGGKSLAGSAHALHYELADVHHRIDGQLQGREMHNASLQQLHDVLDALLNRAIVQTAALPDSYLTLLHDGAPHGLDAWLLSDTALPDAFVLGGVLIVPLPHAHVEHHLPVPEAISLACDPRTAEAIDAVLAHPQRYEEEVVSGVHDLRDFIKELHGMRDSQRLERDEDRDQAYYAIPIAAFVAKPAIAAYCAHLRESREVIQAEALKRTLVQLVRDPYPIESVLPVGIYYRDVPYVYFTSQDLSALRARAWRDGRLVVSTEMNLLGLLLAQSTPDSSE